MACPECLPTRLNPLAERACFSQALSDDLISSYYVGGLYGGLYERLHNKVLSSPRLDKYKFAMVTVRFE